MYKARAFLREQHQGMLLKQLEKLEEKKAELAAQKKEREAARARRRAEGEEEEEEEEEEEGGMVEAPAPEPENTGKTRREKKMGGRGEMHCFHLFSSFLSSSFLLAERDIHIHLFPPSLPPSFSGYDDSAAALALLSTERGKGLAADEATLGKHDEVLLGEGGKEGGGEVVGKTYWWQDKYRPRKPRYFNRVKTGKEGGKEGGREGGREGFVPWSLIFSFDHSSDWT